MHHLQRGARTRRLCIGAIAATALTAGLAAGTASAANAPSKTARAIKPYFDSRAGALATAAKPGGATRFARPSAATTGARVALRASLGSQAVMSIDPLTGTPSQLVRLDGALSGPATGARTTIAMDYVRAHDAALGLTGADLDGLALAQMRSRLLDEIFAEHFAAACASVGANVEGAPSVRPSTGVPLATVRQCPRTASRCSPGTLTGGTSVMCGAMRPRRGSPQARRIPSISVASGCGTRSATASLRRFIRFGSLPYRFGT